MTRSRPTTMRSLLEGKITQVLVFGLLTLALAGCSGDAPGPSVQKLPFVQKSTKAEPLPLPNYTTGSWFEFDDGSRDMVVEVFDEKVIWEDERGRWYASYRNPALPRIRWSRGAANVQADPRVLWPLQPGNTARFNELRKKFEKNGNVERRKRIWSCEVEDGERITTAAGSFDTYPITCQRRSRGRSDRPLSALTFHYAPEIGHFVRRTWINRRGEVKSRELVRHHIEAAARAPAKTQCADRQARTTSAP